MIVKNTDIDINSPINSYLRQIQCSDGEWHYKLGEGHILASETKKYELSHTLHIPFAIHKENFGILLELGPSAERSINEKIFSGSLTNEEANEHNAIRAAHRKLIPILLEISKAMAFGLTAALISCGANPKIKCSIYDTRTTEDFQKFLNNCYCSEEQALFLYKLGTLTELDHSEANELLSHPSISETTFDWIKDMIKAKVCGLGHHVNDTQDMYKDKILDAIPTITNPMQNMGAEIIGEI